MARTMKWVRIRPNDAGAAAAAPENDDDDDDEMVDAEPENDAKQDEIEVATTSSDQLPETITAEDMGLSACLREYITNVTKTAPKGAFLTKIIYEDDQVYCAKIIDVLASPYGIYRWFSPDNQPVDGNSLWMFIVKMIRNAYANKHDMDSETVMVNVIVLVVDDSELVPKHKAKEQARRRKQRIESAAKKANKGTSESPRDEFKWNRKTERIVFVDEGVIRVPKDLTDEQLMPEGDWKITHPEVAGVIAPQKITLDVLRATSALRKPLFDYIKSKLSRWLVKPENLNCAKLDRIMLDYSGSAVFDWRRKHYEGRDVPFNQLVGWGVPVFGEGDGKIVVWARHFAKQYRIIVETIDSDVYPWFIRVYKHFPNGLIWFMEHKSQTRNPKIIDVKVHLDYMMRALGSVTDTSSSLEARNQVMTYKMFVFLCVVCGTDFFDKSDLVYQFTAPAILRAVAKSAKQINAIPTSINRSFEIDALGDGEVTDRETQYVIDAVNTMISHLEYGKKTSRKTQTKPSADKVQEVSATLYWNLSYWSYNFRHVKSFDATESIEDLLASMESYTTSSSPSSSSQSKRKAADEDGYSSGSTVDLGEQLPVTIRTKAKKHTGASRAHEILLAVANKHTDEDLGPETPLTKKKTKSEGRPVKKQKPNLATTNADDDDLADEAMGIIPPSRPKPKLVKKKPVTKRLPWNHEAIDMRVSYLTRQLGLRPNPQDDVSDWEPFVEQPGNQLDAYGQAEEEAEEQVYRADRDKFLKARAEGAVWPYLDTESRTGF